MAKPPRVIEVTPTSLFLQTPGFFGPGSCRGLGLFLARSLVRPAGHDNHGKQTGLPLSRSGRRKAAEPGRQLVAMPTAIRIAKAATRKIQVFFFRVWAIRSAMVCLSRLKVGPIKGWPY